MFLRIVSTLLPIRDYMALSGRAISDQAPESPVYRRDATPEPTQQPGTSERAVSPVPSVVLVDSFFASQTEEDSPIQVNMGTKTGDHSCPTEIPARVQPI